MTKQLSGGFKRSVYWNSYQIIPANVMNQEANIYELPSASFQGVKKLFVLASAIAANAANNKKYLFPRGKIERHNVLIDGRNFYDQPISDLIKQYDEVRKVSTGQGDDYTTGCLLDYAYFKDNYRLTAVGLNNSRKCYAF